MDVRGGIQQNLAVADVDRLITAHFNARGRGNDAGERVAIGDRVEQP